jgi:hypothetical protein
MCSAKRSWATSSRPDAARAELRDGSSSRPGRLEIDVARVPVNRAPVHVAHAHRHPVAHELRHLREIEEEGQCPATPLIMAGSVWIVAAVIVLLVMAAVYLAVQFGL